MYTHQCKFTTICIIYLYPNMESWLNIITDGNSDHVEFDEGKSLKIFLCAPYEEVLHRLANKSFSPQHVLLGKELKNLVEICSNFIFGFTWKFMRLWPRKLLLFEIHLCWSDHPTTAFKKISISQLKKQVLYVCKEYV